MILAAAMLLLAAPAAPPRAPRQQAAQRIVPMDDGRFWSIIARSAQGAAGQAQQESNLRRLLDALSTDELVAWQAAYDAKRAAAYRWSLWGAAYVIYGGASDDSFDHFRHWLIARGRRTYDAALADPDTLADAIPAKARESAEFAGLGYVAMALWAKRTGHSAATMPVGAVQPAEPTGAPFDEDPDALAARYPRLWKRFGHAPLE